MLHGSHVIANVLEILLTVHCNRAIVVVIIVIIIIIIDCSSPASSAAPASWSRAAVVVMAHVLVLVVVAHAAVGAGRHLRESIATIRTRRVLCRDIRIRMVVRVHCYGRCQLDAVACRVCRGVTERLSSALEEHEAILVRKHRFGVFWPADAQVTILIRKLLLKEKEGEERENVGEYSINYFPKSNLFPCKLKNIHLISDTYVHHLRCESLPPSH